MTLVTNPDGTFTIAGIDHTGATDCAPAIQSALDSVYASYGAGLIGLPRPGNFRTESPLTIRGGCILYGHGQRCTAIGAVDVNQGVLTFAAGSMYPGIRDLFAMGFQGPNQQANVVTVEENVPALIQNCHIWGGSSALYTKGIDGICENSSIAGWDIASVLSNGANWFERCKIDTAGHSCQNGFFQGVPIPTVGVKENTFNACDFSGDYVNSITVDDENNGGTKPTTAVSSFSDCVISSPVRLTRQRAATFIGCKFGSNTFLAPPNTTTVSSCVKYGSVLVLPPGVAKAANINIS